MFKRKIKVVFYMKSGNSFSMKFTSFSISKLTGSGGNRIIEWDGATDGFSVDIDRIEAVKIVKTFW